MQNSIEDRKTDILNALEGWIIDKCRTLDTGNGGGEKILNQYTDSIDRLAQLIDSKLVSCVKWDRDNKIIFFRQITLELKRFGAKQLDLPSLADAIPGAEYGKLFHGYKVVKCSIKNLVAFFEGTPSNEYLDLIGQVTQVKLLNIRCHLGTALFGLIYCEKEPRLKTFRFAPLNNTSPHPQSLNRSW